jgi:hypothetical protein
VYVCFLGALAAALFLLPKSSGGVDAARSPLDQDARLDAKLTLPKEHPLQMAQVLGEVSDKAGINLVLAGWKLRRPLVLKSENPTANWVGIRGEEMNISGTAILKLGDDGPFAVKLRLKKLAEGGAKPTILEIGTTPCTRNSPQGGAGRWGPKAWTPGNDLPDGSTYYIHAVLEVGGIPDRKATDVKIGSIRRP